MNKEISKRIEMIKQGKTPLGYKKTKKVGIIPNEWLESKFDKCVEIANGHVDPTKEPYSNMKHIGLGSIEKMTGRLLYVNLAKDEDLTSGKYYFDKDTVLYGKIRPELGKVFYANFEGICSADIYPLKNLESITSKYLKYVLMEKRFYQFAVSVSMRTGMPKINREDISTYYFSLPQKKGEQEKISLILDTFDKAIELKEKLLQEKQKQKKGLMERLLSGKIRLSGFNSKWRETNLDEVLVECNDATTINNQYPVLTSSRKGIYIQSEYFSKQVASEENIGYKVIKKGEFTYRAMSDDGKFTFNQLSDYEIGIVSPSYAVFSVKSNHNDIFIKEILNSDIFTRHLAKEVQGGTRLSLKFKGLTKIRLKMPCLNEQCKIAEILDLSSKEIMLLEKEIESLKDQKKGLMQLLLTGMVRVKCD